MKLHETWSVCLNIKLLFTSESRRRKISWSSHFPLYMRNLKRKRLYLKNLFSNSFYFIQELFWITQQNILLPLTLCDTSLQGRHKKENLFVWKQFHAKIQFQIIFYTFIPFDQPLNFKQVLTMNISYQKDYWAEPDVFYPIYPWKKRM